MSSERARRGRAHGRAADSPGAVPDVLGLGLRVVFCGINPGRVSAAARAHFANSRNDFWRLLADAGFTPRLYEPGEQFGLRELGIGLTNAAYRTTPGSGDLRRSDFAGSAERLRELALDLRPRAIAFVGKEAYRGVFGERPELGAQRRTLADAGLFVLPSTSPANAAVRYPERLRWFRELETWLEPVERAAARALVLDRHDRVLLVQFRDDEGQVWWATPGGGIDDGENAEAAISARACRGGRPGRLRVGARDLAARARLRLAREESCASASASSSCASESTSRRRPPTCPPSRSSRSAGGRSPSSIRLRKRWSRSAWRSSRGNCSRTVRQPGRLTSECETCVSIAARMLAQTGPGPAR